MPYSDAELASCSYASHCMIRHSPAGEVLSLAEAEQRAKEYQAQGLQHTYVMSLM